MWLGCALDSDFASMHPKALEGVAQNNYAQLTEGQSPSSQQAAKPKRSCFTTFEAKLGSGSALSELPEALGSLSEKLPAVSVATRVD